MHDRLDQARHGLMALALVTIIAIVSIMVFTINPRREAFQMTRVFIKSLGLHTPALFPSGRALRDTVYMNLAIDPRHDMHLPLILYFPENMMVGGLEHKP